MSAARRRLWGIVVGLVAALAVLAFIRMLGKPACSPHVMFYLKGTAADCAVQP